jgi:hypothetical protein
MRTKEITVERNFHIMNDDRFIMEKISVTVELNQHDNENSIINAAREVLAENFKAAYPKVYAHLNFDEVIQVKAAPVYPYEFTQETYQGAIKEAATNPNDLQWHNNPEIDKPQTLEEQIKSCTSINVLKAVYPKLVKDKPEQKVYDEQLKKLSTEITQD